MDITDPLRIDGLPLITSPTRGHVVGAMANSETGRMSVAQIFALLQAEDIAQFLNAGAIEGLEEALADFATRLGELSDVDFDTAPEAGKALVFDGEKWVAGDAGSAIASTAEAQAGTNNTLPISPLRLREGLNAAGTAPIFACRAWVLFNGVTGAIRASGNVSSITKNGTGDYTVNFATPMQDADYSAAGSASERTDTSGSALVFIARDRSVPRTAGAFRLVTRYGSTDVSLDVEAISVAIFR